MAGLDEEIQRLLTARTTRTIAGDKKASAQGNNVERTPKLKFGWLPGDREMIRRPDELLADLRRKQVRIVDEYVLSIKRINLIWLANRFVICL